MSSTQSSSPYVLLEENEHDILSNSHKINFNFDSLSVSSDNSDSNVQLKKTSNKTLKKTKSRKNANRNNEVIQSNWSTLKVQTNANRHGECLCCYKFFVDKNAFKLKDQKMKTSNKTYNNKSKKVAVEQNFVPTLSQRDSILTEKFPFNESIRVLDTSESIRPYENRYLQQSFKSLDFLCSSLDDLNLSNTSEDKLTSGNIIDPNTVTTIYIEKQTEFFKRLSQTLNSFVNLNNLALFRLNNDLNLDNNLMEERDSNFYKFNVFEEFLKYSDPMRKWLEKYKSNDYESEHTSKEKLAAGINHKLISDNSKYFELENKLNKYKEKLDSLGQPNREDDLVKEEIELDTKNDDYIAANSASTANHNNQTMSSEKQNKKVKFGHNEIFKKLEERIKLLKMENQNLKVENQYLINKLNLLSSKEYKIIKKNTYESLKFQLKLYKEDYKLEHKEKEQFQRECLELEKKLEKSNNSSHVELFDF